LVHHAPSLNREWLRCLRRRLLVVVRGMVEILLREIRVLGVANRGWVRLVLLVLFVTNANTTTSFSNETFVLSTGQ